MYQIDNPTAVLSRPTPTAAGTAGWFTDGNPASGTPATILPAEFMNMLMAEFLSILSAANVTPNKTNSAQLVQSLISNGIQAEQFSSAVATGTSDAITAAFTPAISAATLAVGVVTLTLWPSAANATSTPTFTPNVGVIAPAAIVKGNNQPLAPGDIAGTGHPVVVMWNPTSSKWVLLNPATGISTLNQYQSISASVASNALTIGFNPGNLVFRNASLTSGVPVNVSIGSALSLTVPSGATLGSVNAVQSQLVLVVLYNGGAPALGIVNIAGGVNLDETTLLSTTAISAGATANNVVYSAAAISNSPFRVVGYVNITEATAGTWATAPTLTQGVGGQALASMQSLGFGQTTQNLSGSRSIGTTYYNSTSRPIIVSITINPINSAVVYLNVNGNPFAQFNMAGYVANTQLIALVLPGQTYSLTAPSGGTVSIWTEIR